MGTELFFVIKTSFLPIAVRLERIRRGWRQVDLAQKAGITQAEVSAFERGQYVIPAVRRRVVQTLDLETIEEIHVA